MAINFEQLSKKAYADDRSGVEGVLANLYYTQMSFLYMAYRRGMISLQDCKREKTQLETDVKAYELMFRVAEEDMKRIMATKNLSELDESAKTCPCCRKIRNIISGIVLEVDVNEDGDCEKVVTT